MFKTLNKISVFFVAAFLAAAALYLVRLSREQKLLQQVIDRLSADSRAAEIMVTRVAADPATGRSLTTIKFLEYGAGGEALEPKIFTFASDIIQFQAMVIRFRDLYVRGGDRLRGRSAFIFMKAFALGDDGAEVYDINRVYEVPSGYRVESPQSPFEKRLWRRFWEYALSDAQEGQDGVKNAQIEAPGTKFIPGYIYTIKIEHDGGLRIDAQAIPRILRDETHGY